MKGMPVFPATGASQWTLDNGLDLIVREDAGAPLASLQVWCRSGSIHEGRWLGGGLSHLLEHMAFKGTERRAGTEIARGVQDVGGYFNAYTSFEQTVYWVDVPREGVATSLDILCDVATCAALPENDLASEQDVIRREIEMGEDDPGQVVSRLMFSTAFSVHPYRFPVIGYLDVFNRLTRGDLAQFYRDHYPPNNLFVVVTGGVDAGEIRGQVESFCGGRPRGAVPVEAIPGEPRQLGRRECHREFQTKLSHLSLAWHIPGLAHEDAPALNVLSTIMGSGRSSRLYSSLREREGVVHSVNAFACLLSECGLFAAGAVADGDNRERAEDRILEIVGEVAREGVAEDEIEKAKNMVTSDQLHALTTTRGQASDLGSNWRMARNLEFTRDYLAAVSRVGRDDLRRVADTYLHAGNLSVISLNPRGSLARAAGARRSAPQGAVRREVLSNGLSVLLREDHRLPLVNVEACFRGGLHAEAPGAGGSMRLFAKTLIKGTAASTGAQLASLLESAGGSLESGSGRSSFGISLDVMAPATDRALGVLAQLLGQPVFLESEMQRERAAQLAAIQADDDRPFSVAARLVRRHLYGDHCYSRDVLGAGGDLNLIGRDTLLELRERLLVGRNGVVAIFGDIDSGRVLATLEDQLAGIPAGERPFDALTRASRGAVADPAEREVTLEKSQAVVMIGYAACNLFHEDRHALEIIDEACSDLSSRLFVRVRDQMGLAYMVGSSFACGLDPGSFAVYAGTDPARAGKTRDALLEEVDQLARDGLGAAELARAKRTYVAKMAMQRQSSGGLAEAMALEEALGLGWNFGEEQRKIVEGLDLDRVNAVARAYLGGRERVVVTVSPEPIS